MLKHKLTVAACLVALAGGGTATVSSYQDHQDQVQVQQAQAAATSEVKMAVRKAKFNAELKQLENLCVQQQAAYTALAPVQKAKATPPECPTDVVVP